MASVLFCFDKWLSPSDFRLFWLVCWRWRCLYRRFIEWLLPSDFRRRNFWKMVSVLFCFDKWLSPSDFRRRNYRPYRLFWLVRWHWRRLHHPLDWRATFVGQLSSTMLHFNQAKQFKFQLLYILQCLSSKMLLLSRTIIELSILRPSFSSVKSVFQCFKVSENH